MNIDANIYTAIQKAIQHYGNKSKFAAAAGIQRSMPQEYIKRFEISGHGIIQEETWERMYEAIKPWLPDSPKYTPRSILDLSQDEVREESPGYNILTPKELLPLIRAWPKLCEMQKEIIKGVVKTILDDQKKQGNSLDQKTA